MMSIRSGITLDASTAVEDGEGLKVWPAGMVLAKISANDKYSFYDDGASDGTEVAIGFLMEEINLGDGDLTVSLLTHGSVIVARLSGLDAAARADLAGRFFWFE